MITIGVDAHKHVQVALAIDEVGGEIETWSGPNSASGWSSLLEWSEALGAVRQFGVEGAWNYGSGLAQFVVA